MYLTLLVHQWKKTIRAKAFNQGWGVRILIGFLILYFGGMFTIFGILLPDLLKEVYPDAEFITPLFSGFILHYILADLAMRFFLQDLNVLSIQHYLLQPIRKSKVINFLLGSSVFSFFNLLPLIIIVPFTIRAVVPEYGSATAVIWFISMLGVVLFDHFTAIYIKRIVAVKQSVFIVFAAVVGLLIVGDGLAWYSLTDLSTRAFSALGKLWFLTIPMAAWLIIYVVNYRFLLKMSYIDKWKKHKKEAASQDFTFLESRGTVGVMMATELKLILRNKRTKSILVMTALLCLYGLLFYGQGDVLEGAYQGMAWKVFAGIFMTGIFMINYGQFLIGWEGAYFDGIMTRAYPMESFFRAKFWLIVMSCTVTYIITLGYAYFTWDAVWINTACFIYNIGVNSFVLLFASTYQKKKIDLSRGSAFNYQGTSAVQFIIVIPLILVPVLIFQGFSVLGLQYEGLAALAGIGLLSLAFTKPWFREILSNYEEKKYRNAAGFREG